MKATERAALEIDRIVCCANESVDILIRLGRSDRIVGRPSQSRQPEVRQAAVVGGYGSMDPEKILALSPDLVITYSDFQHKLAAELIRNHLFVLACNQLDLAGIFKCIDLIGGAVGAGKRAQELLQEMDRRLDYHVQKGKSLANRPRVYFEEWNDPLISGVAWVSEMIEAAGGTDIFQDRKSGKGYLERRVDPEEVIARDPEIILVSWCGKPACIDEITGRKGWQTVSAVKNRRVVELPPEILLQPGPAILDGIAAMQEIFRKWQP
jgi:iron complex transport system substrate-binding protein